MGILMYREHRKTIRVTYENNLKSSHQYLFTDDDIDRVKEIITVFLVIM